MINFEEAYNLVRESVKPLGIVSVDLLESIGTVLAEDVVSDINMPPFDKSAMDGYAVRSSDAESVPCDLEVIGEVKAGSSFGGEVGSGQAVAIMTGAPVPAGADSVVMVEDTAALPEGRVTIKVTPEAGQHICTKAEDVSVGTKVLDKGTPIRGAEVSVLATVGRDRVAIYRRPRVSVITTGDELVGVGEVPKGGQIRNCNGPQLISMLRADGFDVEDLGIVPDDEEALRTAAKRGLENDVLLLTGGVSAGRYDMVPGIMESIGVKTVLHKIAMKPGKPVYFGVLDGKYVFGMPGNPMSTFLAYKVFVRLALNKMMGVETPNLQTEKGRLEEEITLKPDRKKFIPVWAERVGDGWQLKPSRHHGSADIFALTRSNAFAVVEAGIEKVGVGEVVKFFKWHAE